MAKPSWITWPVSTEADGNAAAPLKRQILISITPPDGTVKGTHSIVAVWTPKYGTNKQYTAITFTVGCEITSFTVSNTPSSAFTYSVFYPKKIISLTTVSYVQ